MLIGGISFMTGEKEKDKILKIIFSKQIKKKEYDELYFRSINDENFIRYVVANFCF